MSHSTNTENGDITEQRKGGRERRVGGERRNMERLKHMKGECRCNTPRRATDMAGRLVEGELWWSGF